MPSIKWLAARSCPSRKSPISGGRSNPIDAARALAIAAEHLSGAPSQERLEELEELRIVDGDTGPFSTPACYGAPPQFPRGSWVVGVSAGDEG